MNGGVPLIALDRESRLRLNELLFSRLRALGLRHVVTLKTHTNRSVMLTWRKGVLRLHLGYVVAPDRVLKAIVRFLRPRVPRAVRRELEREFLAFPVHEYVPPPDRRPRPDRPRPGDLRALHELARIHRRLNDHHFGGQLREIPFRLSSRMKTRLGELSVDPGTRTAQEIAISRRHLRRHGWAEVERTVLHEMVHQWQVESGHPLDHGPLFRRKAAAVGIEPRARRGIEPARPDLLSSRG